MNSLWIQSSQQDQVFTGLLIIVGSVLSVAALGGLLVVVMAAAPSITHRACQTLRARAIGSFAVGAISTGALIVLVEMMRNAGPGPHAVMLGVSALAALLGLCASSEGLGRRLSMLSGRDGGRVTQLVGGWAALGLASLVPIVGWFVVLPYAVISGLGATVLGFFHRDEI